MESFRANEVRVSDPGVGVRLGGFFGGGFGGGEVA
jgi:hypothetical protein